MADTQLESETVGVWQMQAGRITHLRIGNEVFCVRDNYPPELNPVRVAKNFMEVIDPKKTQLLRKVQGDKLEGMTGIKSDIKHSRNRKSTIDEIGEPITHQGLIAIYEAMIRAIYRKFGGANRFTLNELVGYFQERYKGLSIHTNTNKARAYVTYMKNEGIISEHKIFGRSKLYRFEAAPYGEQPAAKAEFDYEYAKENFRKESELRKDY